MYIHIYLKNVCVYIYIYTYVYIYIFNFIQYIYVYVYVYTLLGGSVSFYFSKNKDGLLASASQLVSG